MTWKKMLVLCLGKIPLRTFHFLWLIFHKKIPIWFLRKLCRCYWQQLVIIVEVKENVHLSHVDFIHTWAFSYQESPFSTHHWEKKKKPDPLIRSLQWLMPFFNSLTFAPPPPPTTFCIQRYKNGDLHEVCFTTNPHPISSNITLLPLLVTLHVTYASSSSSSSSSILYSVSLVVLLCFCQTEPFDFILSSFFLNDKWNLGVSQVEIVLDMGSLGSEGSEWFILPISPYLCLQCSCMGVITVLRDDVCFTLLQQ